MMETDRERQGLSPEQASFLVDSKVRDFSGKMLALDCGTDKFNQLTTFSSEKLWISAGVCLASELGSLIVAVTSRI